MTDTQKPRSARFWPLQWVRSETFWRDVASRAVSGAVVAAIVAIWAAVAGLISWAPIVGVGLQLAAIVTGSFTFIFVVFEAEAVGGLRGWLLGIVALTVISATVLAGLWFANIDFLHLSWNDFVERLAHQLLKLMKWLLSH